MSTRPSVQQIVSFILLTAYNKACHSTAVSSTEPFILRTISWHQKFIISDYLHCCPKKRCFNTTRLQWTVRDNAQCWLTWSQHQSPRQPYLFISVIREPFATEVAKMLLMS